MMLKSKKQGRKGFLNIFLCVRPGVNTQAPFGDYYFPCIPDWNKSGKSLEVSVCHGEVYLEAFYDS